MQIATAIIYLRELEHHLVHQIRLRRCVDACIEDVTYSEITNSINYRMRLHEGLILYAGVCHTDLGKLSYNVRPLHLPKTLQHSKRCFAIHQILWIDSVLYLHLVSEVQQC
jgi:hypothetical protein